MTSVPFRCRRCESSSAVLVAVTLEEEEQEFEEREIDNPFFNVA